MLRCHQSHCIILYLRQHTVLSFIHSFVRNNKEFTIIQCYKAYTRQTHVKTALTSVVIWYSANFAVVFHVRTFECIYLCMSCWILSYIFEYISTLVQHTHTERESCLFDRRMQCNVIRKKTYSFETKAKTKIVKLPLAR